MVWNTSPISPKSPPATTLPSPSAPTPWSSPGATTAWASWAAVPLVAIPPPPCWWPPVSMTPWPTISVRSSVWMPGTTMSWP